MSKNDYKTYVKSNKELWDKWAKAHAIKQPEGYDVDIPCAGIICGF